MRKTWLVFLGLTLVLSGCSSELVVNAQKHQSVGQHVAKQSLQEAKDLEAKMKDMKVSQRQWIRSVQTLVLSCAQEKFVPTWDFTLHPQTRHLTEKRWEEWKHRCADQVVSETLVYAGEDRAYAVSTAVRHFMPNWNTIIVPSYVSVP